MNKQEMLLIQLMEECAEIQKVASKSLRFGLDNINPKGTSSNEELLYQEFNDLLGTAKLLHQTGVDICSDEALIALKEIKIEKYLKLSEDIGTLDGKETKRTIRADGSIRYTRGDTRQHSWYTEAQEWIRKCFTDGSRK